MASGCASGIRTATSCSMRSAEGRWRTVATASSSVRRRTRLSVPNTTLVREYLEPEEVYEKRPPRGRRLGPARERAPESVRSDLFAVQRGISPRCGIYLPHYLRFEVDHIVALAEDGTPEQRNLQLLCSYCNRAKGTKGKDGYRLKMAELRTDNVATGVMVDEKQAVLTGKRLAGYHRGELQV